MANIFTRIFGFGGPAPSFEPRVEPSVSAESIESRAPAEAFGDSPWNSGSYGREMEGFDPYPGSADTDNRFDQAPTRTRARDLDRNESLARGFLDSTVVSVIGTGLRYTPRPDYVALGKTKQWADEWTVKMKSLIGTALTSSDIDITRRDNAGGIAGLILRNMMMSGGVLVIWKWKRDRTRKWYTAVQLIEADRVSNPFGTIDTKNLRAGQKIDDDGEVLGYYVRRHHPGDVVPTTDPPVWDYVPRRNAYGRHMSILLYRKDRIDQHYGMSWLATVIPEFHTLSQYKKAELQAALANAMIAMIVESNAKHEDVVKMFGGNQGFVDQRTKNNRAIGKKMGFGAVINSFPGDSIKPFSPGRPNEKAVPFLEWATRHIATGMGIPAEVMTHNWAGLNYSNARTVILDSMRTFAVWKDFMERGFYQLTVENLIEEATWRGDVPDCSYDTFYQNKDAWTRSRFSAPAKGWIDPEKEAKAAGERLKLGISTLQKECDEQGEDWREVADQRAAEKDYYDELGLLYTPEMLSENITTKAQVDENPAQTDNGEDVQNDPKQQEAA